MNKLLITLISSLTLLTSCVSLEDYKALQNDYQQFKRQNLDQIKALETRMETFTKTYDEDLRTELEANLQTVKLISEKIRQYSKEIQTAAGEIKTLSIDATADREIVAENRKLSDVQTVVREFETLRRDWERTLRSAQKTAEVAGDSAAAAARLTSTAARQAESAQDQAEKAARSASVANAFLDRIDQLEKKIAALELKMPRTKTSDK